MPRRWYLQEKMTPSVQAAAYTYCRDSHRETTGQWQGKVVYCIHAGNYYFNTEDAQVSPGGTFDLIYTYTDSNQCTNSDTLQMTLYNTPVPEAGSYPGLVQW